MNNNSTGWFGRLREIARERRRANPLPGRNTLSTEEEFHYRIIGGALVRWLQHYLPKVLEERNAGHPAIQPNPEPHVVFISSPPGLMAACEILEPPSDQVVCITTDEYREYVEDAPDINYESHLSYSSYVEDIVPDELRALIDQSYPLEAGEVFWLHYEETIWGNDAGHGTVHLWKWNGQEPQLLEEGLTTWIM